MYQHILRADIRRDFRRYVEGNKLQYGDCQGNGNIFWSPEFEQTQPGHVWSTFRNKLEDLSTKLKFPSSCLIQFLSYEPDSDIFLSIPEDEPGHVPNNEYFEFIQFTSKHQPFILSPPVGRGKICEELCFYRMNISELPCWNHWKVCEQQEEVSVVGRVFQNQRMEFTPDVCYYSNEEYPPRTCVFPFHVKGSVTIPLARSLGVMEIVWMRQPDNHFWQKDLPDFVSGLQESDLIVIDTGWCINLCGQYDKKSLGNDISEITEVLKVLGRTCDLPLAQTWILCKSCNSLSTPQRVDCELHANHINRSSCHTDFLHAQSLCTLLKGKGVVGNAVLNPNLVFCEDVAKLSVREYPLAHFARRYNLSACLAFCLSSTHTGQVYVLELFLPSSCLRDDYPIAKFIPVLEDIRKNFPNFNIGSGEEKLYVQMIDLISPYEYEGSESEMPSLIDNEINGANSTATIETAIFDECDTISLENQNIIEDMIIESADAPGVLEMEDGNVRTVHSEQSLSREGIIVSISETSTLRSKTTRGVGRIPFTHEELKKCMDLGMSREDAASYFHVSLSTFKRRCRKFDIPRWPNTRKGSSDHKGKVRR